MSGFAPNVGGGLTKTGLGRLNRSVEAFVYCVVGAEVNVRSSIVDSGGGGQETQQEMLKLFEDAVIEEDISKSVQRYQLVIQEAKLRLDFAIAPNVWLMPTNLIINTESVIGYNNFLLKAKSDMTFGENKLLNREIKKVGIAHNLGTNKINQHVAPEIHTIIPNDNDDKIKINSSAESSKNKQSSMIDSARRSSADSSHDQIKATIIILAAIVGYMVFR